MVIVIHQTEEKKYKCGIEYQPHSHQTTKYGEYLDLEERKSSIVVALKKSIKVRQKPNCQAKVQVQSQDQSQDQKSSQKSKV